MKIKFKFYIIILNFLAIILNLVMIIFALFTGSDVQKIGAISYLVISVFVDSLIYFLALTTFKLKTFFMMFLASARIALPQIFLLTSNEPYLIVIIIYVALTTALLSIPLFDTKDSYEYKPKLKLIDLIITSILFITHLALAFIFSLIKEPNPNILIVSSAPLACELAILISKIFIKDSKAVSLLNSFFFILLAIMPVFFIPFYGPYTIFLTPYLIPSYLFFTYSSLFIPYTDQKSIQLQN